MSRSTSLNMATVQPNQGMLQQQQQQQQGNAVINQVLPAGMTGEQVKAMFQVGSDVAMTTCWDKY